MSVSVEGAAVPRSKYGFSLVSTPSPAGYDFVIVGAGSAGCVLADRLSASGQFTVLLLEAGGDDQLPAVSLASSAPTLIKTDVDWQYRTESTTDGSSLRGCQDGVGTLPRGKLLGGSGSINFMVPAASNTNTSCCSLHIRSLIPAACNACRCG